MLISKHVLTLQVLFRPLLRSLGIYIGAVKTSAFMKKFGGNVSIQGSLQTLRVDIVDSEQSSSRKKNSKSKQRIRKFHKFSIDMGRLTKGFCNRKRHYLFTDLQFASILLFSDVIYEPSTKTGVHNTYLMLAVYAHTVLLSSVFCWRR